MGSGGARSRSGPAPDPNALRRERDRGEWVWLPECREGPVPEWPLEDQLKREAVLWERLWRMPQAVMWERLGQELEVALYVRRFCEAEKPNAPTTLGTLVRQMSDSLGLTTAGLRSNKWQIGGQVEPVKRRASSSSSRARLKVVADDVAGA